MESFNKLFDRLSRTFQNLKQPQAPSPPAATPPLTLDSSASSLSPGDGPTDDQFSSGASPLSITPSPCQPPSAHYSLSSQSSVSSGQHHAPPQPPSSLFQHAQHGAHHYGSSQHYPSGPHTGPAVGHYAGGAHGPGQHHHPSLVASSSQPLMPATSPYAVGAAAPGGNHYPPHPYQLGGHGNLTHHSHNHTHNQGLHSNSSSTNNVASTTSNSPSSCSAVSPAPTQSYSAVQTPDSPVGLPRRQLSLTVGQRSNMPAKLHLDLNRKPKNCGSQGSIFANNTTDVINQHSLSPRPRPRNRKLHSTSHATSTRLPTPLLTLLLTH